MKIRKNICAEKIKLLEDGVKDLECLQMLDAMEQVVSSCVGADHLFEENKFSELTFYRKFATILNIILRDTMLTVDEYVNCYWTVRTLLTILN